MKRIIYSLTAVVMMAVSPPLHASTVASLIDIKFTPNTSNTLYNYSGAVTYDGSVQVGNIGDVWNILEPDLSAGVSTTLMLTSGASSPATLTFSSEGITTLAKATSGFYGSGLGEYKNLMNSYNYVVSGETGSFTISGLAAYTHYDVYVLTQGNKADNGSILQLTGPNKVGDPTTYTQAGTSNATNSTFLTGQNYMMETFRADAGGNLTIEYSSAVAGKNAIVNGIQITNSAAPEPASMLLIGVGSVLISSMKLRKKNSADNSVA